MVQYFHFPDQLVHGPEDTFSKFHFISFIPYSILYARYLLCNRLSTGRGASQLVKHESGSMVHSCHCVDGPVEVGDRFKPTKCWKYSELHVLNLYSTDGGRISVLAGY